MCTCVYVCVCMCVCIGTHACANVCVCVVAVYVFAIRTFFCHNTLIRLVVFIVAIIITIITVVFMMIMNMNTDTEEQHINVAVVVIPPRCLQQMTVTATRYDQHVTRCTTCSTPVTPWLCAWSPSSMTASSMWRPSKCHATPSSLLGMENLSMLVSSVMILKIMIIIMMMMLVTMSRMRHPSRTCPCW